MIGPFCASDLVPTQTLIVTLLILTEPVANIGQSPFGAGITGSAPPLVGVNGVPVLPPAGGGGGGATVPAADGGAAEPPTAGLAGIETGVMMGAPVPPDA